MSSCPLCHVERKSRQLLLLVCHEVRDFSTALGMTKRAFTQIDLLCVAAEMKADRNSREPGARLPCRDHPVLCLSLFAFMFVPAVAGEVALGRWLTQFMPHPGLIAMLCFAPLMVILFIIGMLIGATIWLLLMKRFVHQSILAAFFLGGPRVPEYFNICSKI